jgi:hypothetical protein
LFGQKKILRSRQKVLTAGVPAVIDALLDVRQQIWRVLNLVKDDWRRVYLQKTARIGRCRGANVGWLQRDIAGRFAEDMLQQCGLARLARSR